jgi:pimeloyl-ACP methyl ester carboxylesterase
MATFVLIHGARGGGWSWSLVIPTLEKAGHRVVTPDLPGHGENRKIATEKITMQNWIDCFVEVLDQQLEPVILVGHSMGGMVISQAAEYRPDKIKKLVYLAAFLLKDGESLHSRGGGHHNPQTDAALKELLCADCSDEILQWYKARMAPAPAMLAGKPIHITTKNYGRLPRVYIECLQDKAIPPSVQKQMYTDSPCERVITMNTSHSPNLSAPEALARNLLSILKS